MTTFLLIRHASHDLLGKALAGRSPDLHLNARGKLEAERLADRLTSVPIRAIYTSPMERAQETAWPLAGKLMLELRVHEGLDEIEFGDWTRKTFSELDPTPEWQLWNTERSRTRPPGGESMVEVQQRMVKALEQLNTEHGDEHVALISHGDVIKSALMHYLGMSLDHFLRLEISAASVSILVFHGDYAQVTLVNEIGELSSPRSARRGGA